MDARQSENLDDVERWFKGLEFEARHRKRENGAEQEPSGAM
jgi:heme-degrading monooxygenase HmoA